MYKKNKNKNKEEGKKKEEKKCISDTQPEVIKKIATN